ncbi:hypothetical protein C7M84_003215 [Penaeus vannamei]|uniref:Coiled-coil domain-containing protein 93 n=1 Tax=Penaeus vannamei TaxID=6689 RepID=A0A423TNS5_PENVA|nr:hypothetical protein C7M84_003215 [Penaeus vannamei]
MISAESRPRSNTAREGQVDIREDEEQGLKLSEIVELLVAAGYFRARIKGLSPFDKVVGGLTWCIETCNFDVDVDLLFSENLTIGQKIALTERIVRVVQSMKCPHQLEPHQIQGLDAIHIFPVIQWLGSYGPKRRWRRKNSTPQESESQRIQTTLLEYGQLSYMGIKKTPNHDEPDANTEMAEVEQLMQSMDVADVTEGKLSAQYVGSIVSTRVNEIAATSKHYSELQQQISEEILGDSASSHARLVATLEKQRTALSKQLAEQQKKEKAEHQKVEELKAKLQDVKRTRTGLEQEIQELGIVDTRENNKLLEHLSKLVAENEAVRKKEAEYKDGCRKESEKLKKEISDLQTRLKEIDVGDEITERYTAEKEKYSKMRRQLAKKTRQVEAMKRVIDDVPGRAELSQYQRRFIELYNQVAATHRETQQFYNMYNTLADTKTYMDKELSLLNSILDNMAIALSNSANMDEYLQQLDTIVEGIHQNRLKLQKRQAEERSHRNTLSDELARLQELNRHYAKTVHQLGQEIKKNEILHQKVTQKKE